MIERSSAFRVAAGIWAAMLAVGCAPEQEAAYEGPVSDEAYVGIMTELMLLDSDPPAADTEEVRESKADSVRSEVLAAHGLTAREILDFTETVGSEAGRMEELWQQITHRYDSARVADLKAETEAQSEAEGKLGEEARAVTARPSAAPDADSVEVSADSSGVSRGREKDLPSRIQRRLQNRPPVSDTTSPPR